MDDDFFKDRARIARDLADKADPFTRKRLLELAAKYESRPRRPAPLPLISAKANPRRENGSDKR